MRGRPEPSTRLEQRVFNAESSLVVKRPVAIPSEVVTLFVESVLRWKRIGRCMTLM